MKRLSVKVDRIRSELPPGTVVWSGRWCHRRKGEGVRSRYVVRQFRFQAGLECFSGTPTKEAVRILLAIALKEGYAIVTGDFSVAFMHIEVDPYQVLSNSNFIDIVCYRCRL